MRYYIFELEEIRNKQSKSYPSFSDISRLVVKRLQDILNETSISIPTEARIENIVKTDQD